MTDADALQMRDYQQLLSAALGFWTNIPFSIHTVELGDWSLLDTVRARPRMWREADG